MTMPKMDGAKSLRRFRQSRPHGVNRPCLGVFTPCLGVDTPSLGVFTPSNPVWQLRKSLFVPCRKPRAGSFQFFSLWQSAKRPYCERQARLCPASNFIGTAMGDAHEMVRARRQALTSCRSVLSCRKHCGAVCPRAPNGAFGPIASCVFQCRQRQDIDNSADRMRPAVLMHKAPYVSAFSCT